jgi:hypothetical protein
VADKRGRREVASVSPRSVSLWATARSVSISCIASRLPLVAMDLRTADSSALVVRNVSMRPCWSNMTPASKIRLFCFEVNTRACRVEGTRRARPLGADIFRLRRSPFGSASLKNLRWREWFRLFCTKSYKGEMALTRGHAHLVKIVQQL